MSLLTEEQLQRKRQKTKEWKLRNAERVKESHKQYYQENKGKAKESTDILRECACGAVAITEDDLKDFVKSKDSKYGYRNTCLACTAHAARDGRAKAEMQKTCTSCGKVVHGELQIAKEFRQARTAGDRVVGQLVSVCKVCEFPKELYYEIDGRYILIEDFLNPRGLHRVPAEVM